MCISRKEPLYVFRAYRWRLLWLLGRDGVGRERALVVTGGGLLAQAAQLAILQAAPPPQRELHRPSIPAFGPAPASNLPLAMEALLDESRGTMPCLLSCPEEQYPGIMMSLC